MTGNLRHMNNVMAHRECVRADVKEKAYKSVKHTEATIEKSVEEGLPLVHESCRYSNFSFAAAVSGLLVFAGIILYALIV